MMFLRSALVLGISALFLFGCTGGPEADRAALLSRAAQGGFAQTHVPSTAQPFALLRQGTSIQPALVVIESDGLSFLDSFTPSPDPTPRDPMGYHLAAALAAAQPDRTVLYVARPCHYLKHSALARCPANLWLMDRFGAAAQQRVSGVIQQQLGRAPIILLGISGGGVVAAHLARQLPNTQALITIAAPLALNNWADHHGVTRFNPADDPINIAFALTALPQLHIGGTSDSIVPAAHVASFAHQSRGQMQHIQRTRHTDMWRAAVQPILKRLSD